MLDPNSKLEACTPQHVRTLHAPRGGQAFFVIRGEGGGILEEAGTFSGQALLLSYPYPRGACVHSARTART